jgi:hypothetical protein
MNIENHLKQKTNISKILNMRGRIRKLSRKVRTPIYVEPLGSID